MVLNYGCVCLLLLLPWLLVLVLALLCMSHAGNKTGSSAEAEQAQQANAAAAAAGGSGGSTEAGAADAEDVEAPKDRSGKELHVGDRVQLLQPLSKIAAAEAVVKVVGEGSTLLIGKDYKVSCCRVTRGVWLQGDYRIQQYSGGC